MAFTAVSIASLVVVACLAQGWAELTPALEVRSETIVRDPKGQLIAFLNVTIEASGDYNHTRDSAFVNAFVQKKIKQLQKSPELYAVSGGQQRPLPLVYYMQFRELQSVGPQPVRRFWLAYTLELYAKKKRSQEALFALTPPSF